ncbi:hypothetical protein [Streptomyces sp. NPDC017993]|uniref:hypothetical protein n=1 Tax=Streptomyces sp. NPDC017993 TaxID=3365027 RepID=UPI00379E7B93
METNDDAPQLARSAAAVFARRREAFAALLLRHGLPEERGKICPPSSSPRSKAR